MIDPMEDADAVDDLCEYCPVREDQQHCHCWYDGYVCCACGAPADDTTCVGVCGSCVPTICPEADPDGE